MLRNQWDRDDIILLQLANPYMNYQFKHIHWLFSQNVNFRLNAMLHGALQLIYWCIYKLKTEYKSGIRGERSINPTREWCYEINLSIIFFIVYLWTPLLSESESLYRIGNIIISHILGFSLSLQCRNFLFWCASDISFEIIQTFQQEKAPLSPSRDLWSGIEFSYHCKT